MAFETLALHILMNGPHRIRILFRDLQYDYLRLLALSVLLPENTELEVEVGYGRETAGGINMNLMTRMRPTLDITRRDVISRKETSERCMEMAVEPVCPQR